jgi:hypothetical protein
MDRPPASLLRRLTASAGVTWAAVTARTVAQHGPREWVRRCCDDCGMETPHEAHDEIGPGWYAQFWRCRRCERQVARVWVWGGW